MSALPPRRRFSQILVKLGPAHEYSRIPGTQPHECEYRIPPDEPWIRQEHVHIQGYCIHTTG